MASPADPDEMPFSLDWLAGTAGRIQALAVCDQGHLVINGNTHWQPRALSQDLRTLICRITDHPPGDA